MLSSNYTVLQCVMRLLVPVSDPILLASWTVPEFVSHWHCVLLLYKVSLNKWLGFVFTGTVWPQLEQDCSTHSISHHYASEKLCSAVHEKCGKHSTYFCSLKNMNINHHIRTRTIRWITDSDTDSKWNNLIVFIFSQILKRKGYIERFHLLFRLWLEQFY